MNLTTLKGKIVTDPDFRKWTEAVRDMSMRDIEEYMGVWVKREEYEICAVLRDELKARKEQSH
jgi:protein-arginine kinase activator protein McsA